MVPSEHNHEEMAGLGRETGARVLGALERERLVPVFVDSYVKRHNRRELKTSPLRYRELLITLTRESLLAIVVRVNSDLQRRLQGRRSAPTAEEREAMDAFAQAMLGALGAALSWTPGDIAEFARDVSLYARMTAMVAPPASSRNTLRGGKRGAMQLRSRSAPPAGPFADRCALLLDPSLLEQARASAVELHVELERIAKACLAGALRQKR